MDKLVNTKEYDSVLKKKKNELSGHEMTRRNLKGVTKRKKATHCMMPTIRHSGKGITMETAKRSVAAREEREWRMNRRNTEDL